MVVVSDCSHGNHDIGEDRSGDEWSGEKCS